MSSSELLKNELARCWQWRIDTDPELAAALGLLSRRTMKHALDPRSLKSFEERLQFIQSALERIQKLIIIDPQELNEEEKLSYELYVNELTNYCENTPKYKTYLCCVNCLDGPHTDLPLYARYLPLISSEDRLFYCKFLEAIDIQIDEEIGLLKVGLSEHRTPAKASMDGVVKLIRDMIQKGMNEFWEPIQGCFPENEKYIEEKCKALIQGPVTLAFSRLADYLETDYIPNIRTDISSSTGYPDGEAYFQACLQFHTTTVMTPTDIHQLGLSEVVRIRYAMEGIARDAGYHGRLDEYLEYLRTSKDYEPPSAQALLTYFRDITGRIGPKLLQMFHLRTLPRMPFAVAEIPAERAPSGPAAYYLAGSADPLSPRPGMLYVNTFDLPTRRMFACEALALHESIPGHHTQSAIQAENINLPDFRHFQEDRRYFEAPCRFPFYTGYIEGWALHCETLGTELGLYETRESLMGQLSMEALRACRLVVDTGIHSMGWNQNQAVEYMLTHTAMGRHDAETEVARYITWPGQACAYKVGERCFHQLRAKAETELGQNFDKRDFYDIVMECGPVPLPILEQRVERYIQSFPKTRHATLSSSQRPDLVSTHDSIDQDWILV